jgi:outer membrane protein assembly factor BamD (BamD/ComL family)
METEFPKSVLLNDALAEEIFAEGAQLKDVEAAEQTFQKLINEFPNGNAVDNAYTWMGIIYRCVGRTDEAAKINMDILRKFPTTRHAIYAMERMLHPEAKACGLNQSSDDEP